MRCCKAAPRKGAFPVSSQPGPKLERLSSACVMAVTSGPVVQNWRPAIPIRKRGHGLFLNDRG